MAVIRQLRGYSYIRLFFESTVLKDKAFNITEERLMTIEPNRRQSGLFFYGGSDYSLKQAQTAYAIPTVIQNMKMVTDGVLFSHGTHYEIDFTE